MSEIFNVEWMTLVFEVVGLGAAGLTGVWKLSAALATSSAASRATTSAMLELRADLNEERDTRRAEVSLLTQRVDQLASRTPDSVQH